MSEKNLSQIQESLEKSIVHQNKKPEQPSPIALKPSEQNQTSRDSQEQSDNNDS